MASQRRAVLTKSVFFRIRAHESMNMWRFSPPPLRKHELRASRYIKHHMHTDVMCKPLKIQFFSVPTEGAVIQQASIKMWSSCRLTDSKQDRSGSLPCGPPASGWLPWGRERRCCWRRCTAATAVWTWARTCRRKQKTKACFYLCFYILKCCDNNYTTAADKLPSNTDDASEANSCNPEH